MRASFLWQLGLAGIAISSPVQPAKKGLKTPAFFLAGDSTTASGGGWGNGFLTTLVGGANGTNFGHNGATTESFRAGGDWANVTGAVKRASATHSPYVTIQFGHNDQKPIKNITVAEFKVNMKKFAQEVIAAGGTPILVTSLSRRRYVNGSIDLDLVDQVKATLAVASDLKAAVIDLNAASMKYLNAIGETKARTYDKVLDDSTHLNPNAGLVFGNMVAGLILESSVGHLVKPYVKENASIKAAIAAGKYILPSN